MNADQVRWCGEALYGERWQTALAEDLLVSSRTMRRWIGGKTAIPENVRGELLHLIAERIHELHDAAEELS